MNTVAGLILSAVGLPIIIYAEFQSETNVALAVLENKGIEADRQNVRSSLNKSCLYRFSNICFILFIVSFGFFLWKMNHFSELATMLATLAMLCSGGLAFVTRAIALIRVVNQLQAALGQPHEDS
jgi:hypothetical protein